MTIASMARSWPRTANCSLLELTDKELAEGGALVLHLRETG